MEKFDNLNKKLKEPEDSASLEIKKLELFYEKMSRLDQDVQVFISKSVINDCRAIFIDEKKLENLYGNIVYFELEILQNKLLDNQIKTDIFQRINLLKSKLISFFDVISWPPSFTGEKRIEEEEKSRKFLEAVFAKESERMKLKRNESEDDYPEFMRKILYKLTDPLFRSEIENSDKLFGYGWLGDSEVKMILEKLRSDQSEAVFSKLSKLVCLALKEQRQIGDILEIENLKILSEIKLKLFEKAKNVIASFGDKLRERSVANTDEIDKLLADLENTKTEIILLSTLLKTAKEKGEKIDFEMIKDLKLERRIIGEKDENGQKIELNEDEKEEMLKMVEKNYREVVYPDNLEAAEAVIGDFRKELAEGFSGQIIYTLKFQNKLTAFVRFKKLNDEEVYAGSLNVHEEVNNLCIGKYFTGSVLPEISKQYRIKAITRATNPAIPMYEKQGFVLDREHSFEKHGEMYYNMVMERKS